MALDWITTPVSDDAPCGPDLDATDDGEYVDYYFDALGRLPDRYFTPGVDRGEELGMSAAIIFDPKTVEVKRELDQVDGMLKRSRDLRLMALRAQWQILGGRLEDMALTVDAIASAIETFGTDLHPSTSGGIGDRRDALMELAQQNTVLLPLMYQPLDTTGSATLRRMRVAQGDFTPQLDEEGIEAGSITSTLASPGDRKKVDASHEALLTIRTAIDRITAACKANESGPFSPGLDPLTETIDKMLAMIGDARPDLRDAADVAAAEADAEGGEVDPGEEGDAPESSGGGGVTVAGAPVHVGPVQSHAAARQALLATEAYLQRYEPSSAALLLVTQARQLIGMPLMQAMQILLPEHAHRAIVTFGPQDGFGLTTDRLNSLSGEIGGAPVDEDIEEVPEPPVVDSSNAAAAVLRTVEDFYRTKEKSSPVPIILQRARTYMSKDFQSLIDELIPPVPEKEPY